MKASELIQLRIDFIEKNYKSPFKSYRNWHEMRLFRQILPLCFWGVGILFSLLTSLGVDFFAERWINSGLYIRITTPIIMWLYSATIDNLIHQHMTRLQAMKTTPDCEKQIVVEPENESLKILLNTRPITIQIPLFLLGTTALVCYMGKFTFWMHFDVIVFITWSSYAIFYWHNISRMKGMIKNFELNFQEQ